MMILLVGGSILCAWVMLIIVGGERQRLVWKLRTSTPAIPTEAPPPAEPASPARDDPTDAKQVAR